MRFGSQRCRWMSPALGLLVAVGLLLASPAALAADRVALVVGNSAYTAIGALPNPGNDATDVAASLGRLGFDVTTVRDADRVGLSEALRVFTRESAGADVSLVFYAGHGLEMDGVNYLVPVDAQLERDTDVRFEAVELDDVLAATTGAGLRIVILDACRNNPLARSMQRTVARRSVSGGSFGDLNEDLLGTETLVAYAAAAGTTAADGTGRNSPYTAALLAHLEQPVEIGLLFRRVRAEVLAATNGEQRPHEYHSLLSEHFLLSGVPGAAAVTVEASAPEVADVDATELSVEQLRELAVEQLQQMAELGIAGAQNELGARYSQGRDVGRDPEEAARWYRRAAEQGLARAQTNLGDAYENGRGVQQHYGEALRWFLRAADQGDVFAPGNLGDLYRDGNGVGQDHEEAARWYRRGADQGNSFAQTSLGTLYRDGYGVSQDDAEAVRWYRLAAEQGNPYAQNLLGFMYEHGRGVRRDRLEAARWYRLAANQGLADAQRRLDLLR